MVFQYARPLMPKQEKVYKSIKPMFKQGVWRIFVGDTVEILQGPESGLQGKVLAVIRDPRRPQVLVEGRNLVRPLPPSPLARPECACLDVCTA